ncbi:ABC transporter permease [Zoogloea sp.]|uniref:ABC transporter permease n=1 Tax=Zoogloea sp. TaxID=49181 RepID=UPI0026232042|nr:ABC transporter permease [Zoogloea sp.]MDD3352881.1 ABC transporter permease [Zoogloea sp.]
MAEIQPVLLWTDLLLFGLLACTVFAAWNARRNEPMRSAWRRVGQSAVGMSALTLLSLFLCVGFLDSLHYRERLPATAELGVGAETRPLSSEVRSALDALAAPLRNQVEKTYSAPLAYQLFAQQTVERPDGVQARDFPRLKFGGDHLQYPEADHSGDVLGRVGIGLALAGLGWLLLAALLVVCVARHRGVPFGPAWRAVWRGRGGLAWRAVLLTLAAVMVVAGPVASLATAYHVFGTDKVGQDVLFLTLKSIRTALVIGTLTTLVTLPLAVVLGILAGYLGGWVDDAIQYTYTVLNSIPGVLLIAAAVLMMQVLIDTHPEWFETAADRADARLLSLCLILGMTSWTGLCRLLRGETLKLRELEYVQAAQAFGASTPVILSRHILPNLMHLVLIALVMDFSGLVLAEAVLSYVGIGVDPGTVSFGTMINAARMELAREPMVWWSLIAAFIFMFGLVLAANVFADVVRDAFDPRSI